jgi:hypothetical protein
MTLFASLMNEKFNWLKFAAKVAIDLSAINVNFIKNIAYLAKNYIVL